MPAQQHSPLISATMRFSLSVATNIYLSNLLLEFCELFHERKNGKLHKISFNIFKRHKK